MSPQHGRHHRRPCFTTGGATTSSVKLIPQERAKNLEVEQIMDLIDVFVIRQGQVPVKGTTEVVKLAPHAGASHREDGATSNYAGSAFGGTCQAFSCSEGIPPGQCSFLPAACIVLVPPLRETNPRVVDYHRSGG